jgi:hypothetical protein
MIQRILLGLIVGLPLATGQVGADMNKCRDAQGRVTYTDAPCPGAAGVGQRVEVPPLPKADISSLPRDAQNRPILNQSGGAAIVLAPREKPGPANALAACSALVTRCVVPGRRELDDCFLSAPRCASARPWEEVPYKPCCTEACWQRYQGLRQAGQAPLKAFDLALFGAGSVDAGCLPAR